MRRWNSTTNHAKKVDHGVFWDIMQISRTWVFKFHANFIHISCTCFHTPSGSVHANFMHLFSHPSWDPFTQISRTGTLLIDRDTILFVLCHVRGLQISLVFHTASPQAWHLMESKSQFSLLITSQAQLLAEVNHLKLFLTIDAFRFEQTEQPLNSWRWPPTASGQERDPGCLLGC